VPPELGIIWGVTGNCAAGTWPENALAAEAAGARHSWRDIPFAPATAQGTRLGDSGRPGSGRVAPLGNGAHVQMNVPIE
jgi:hypothetical protein